MLFVIGATSQLTEYIGDIAGKDSTYAKVSMVAAPLIRGAVALWVLQPWHNDPDYKKNKKRIITSIFAVGIVFLLWWGGASCCKTTKPADEKCATGVVCMKHKVKDGKMADAISVETAKK